MATLDLAGIITRVCTDLREKFASKSELSAKQDTLVSGTNIKTVNSNSLVGSGNISIDNSVGYQLRTENASMTASDSCGTSRIWFTSADGTKMVPINTSTSGTSTSAKTLNTRPIDPFGRIIHYTATTATANSYLSYAKQWDQHSLTIGYSYVVTLTNRLPVYLKCTPQSDGSAVMADIVQALPSTKDGYIYIFLGVAYSTTNMELLACHPVYYHDGIGIKLWNGNTKYSISSLGGTGTNYFWANKGCATLMSSGTTPSAQWGSANVCTIPDGYRPPTIIYLPVQKDGAIASDTYLIVHEDGSVTIQNGGGTQAAATYRVTATWAYY